MEESASHLAKTPMISWIHSKVLKKKIYMSPSSRVNLFFEKLDNTILEQALL